MSSSPQPAAELAKLQFTLEAANAATWDIDLVANTVVWSENAEQVLGLRPGALSTTFVAEPEWIHPEDRARTLTALWEVARGGETYVIEHRIVTADGETRWVTARGGAVLDDDGSPARVVGVLVDITDRQLLAERLRGELAAKDRFLTTIGHELRTPLTAILGFSAELHDRLSDEELAPVRDLAQIITQQADQMVALIDDLLVAGRDADSPVPIDPHQVELCGTVRRVIDGWPDEHRRIVSIDEGPVRAFADPIRLRQIVRNLIDNAIRYGGQTITVRCWETPIEGRSHLVVIDDGPGIPSTPPEPDTGVHPTGIGLAVSRRLAERMGGSLSYEHVDGTTRFELVLPLEA